MSEQYPSGQQSGGYQPAPQDSSQQQGSYQAPQGGYPAPQGGGYPPPPPYYGQPPAQQSNGMAVASLVCGIIGLLLFWFILSPLAIIFGGVALSRANKGAPRKNMAIAGLVLGIVGLLGYIILIAVATSSGRFVV